MGRINLAQRRDKRRGCCAHGKCKYMHSAGNYHSCWETVGLSRGTSLLGTSKRDDSHTHVIKNTTREISYLTLKYVRDKIHYLILSSRGWCQLDFKQLLPALSIAKVIQRRWMDGEIKLMENPEVLGEKSVPMPLCPPPVAYRHAPNRNICKRLFGWNYFINQL